MMARKCPFSGPMLWIFFEEHFHFETCDAKYLHTFLVFAQFVFTPPLFIYV